MDATMKVASLKPLGDDEGGNNNNINDSAS